jgi:proteasome lid subunit RPN8/RPN11
MVLIVLIRVYLRLIQCSVMNIQMSRAQFNEIVAHACEASPHECCGLIGGAADVQAKSIYRTRNIAADPLVAYEAAPEDLFAAQRIMRERGEELIAIYHSHPRSSDPQPSATDVRLAYYPAAVYLIVGLGDSNPCMRAFRLIESEARWKPVDYEVID